VLVLPAFLFGMGHEPPLQQQDAFLSMPLQQEWAFLRFFVLALQQDIAASLQQFSMSQQAAEFWLLF